MANFSSYAVDHHLSSNRYASENGLDAAPTMSYDQKYTLIWSKCALDNHMMITHEQLRQAVLRVSAEYHAAYSL